MKTAFWTQKTHLLRADKYIGMSDYEQKALSGMSRLWGEDEKGKI